jgi:putative transposase
MRKNFTEEQIISILKQQENGVPVKEIIRQHNITEQTFYRWKSKYGGMEVSDARKLKQLEDENSRLKQLVAELTLDKQALQWVVEKNQLSLPVKKK